jgi:hypothetical protein
MGYNIAVPETTAGANSKCSDISVLIKGNRYMFEVKNKGAFEGGGKRFQVGEYGLYIPEDSIHKTLLGNYIPWGGRVPSFLKGDKSLTTWDSEKATFKDEYIEVPEDTICKYYKEKGVSYIQVECKGVYHTGEDVLGFNVPVFSCSIKIRIRCKRHTSGPMPSTVQASFIYNRKTIPSSPYDIVSNPPPCLQEIPTIE